MGKYAEIHRWIHVEIRAAIYEDMHMKMKVEMLGLFVIERPLRCMCRSPGDLRLCRFALMACVQLSERSEFCNTRHRF